MSVSRGPSISASSASGKGSVWLERPVSARWSQSEVKGVTGAMSNAVTRSASCRVAKAAAESAASALPQKRERERRTYQFESSPSTKAATAR